VNSDGSSVTFRALVHKSTTTKMQIESGIDEVTTRDVSFFADDARGKALLMQYAEMQVAGVRYQIDRFEANASTWRVTLRRVGVQEVSRSNRRGRQ
jgi:hypothetical protein